MIHFGNNTPVGHGCCFLPPCLICPKLFILLLLTVQLFLASTFFVCYWAFHNFLEVQFLYLETGTARLNDPLRSYQNLYLNMQWFVRWQNSSHILIRKYLFFMYFDFSLNSRWVWIKMELHHNLTLITFWWIFISRPNYFGSNKGVYFSVSGGPSFSICFRQFFNETNTTAWVTCG